MARFRESPVRAANSSRIRPLSDLLEREYRSQVARINSLLAALLMVHFTASPAKIRSRSW